MMKLKIHKAVYLKYQKVYLDTFASCNGKIYLGRITSKNKDVTCKRCIGLNNYGNSRNVQTNWKE